MDKYLKWPSRPDGLCGNHYGSGRNIKMTAVSTNSDRSADQNNYAGLMRKAQ